MDPAAISLFVAQTLPVLQPYLPLIAAKAAEKLGSELPATVGNLWQTIWKKFQSKPAAQEAAADLLKNPADPDVQAAFRLQLKKALEEDGAFADELKHLVAEAGPGISYQAQVVGDGAIAQGQGAQAVGKGGVIVQGSVSGDVITGGTNTNPTQRRRKA